MKNSSDIMDPQLLRQYQFIKKVGKGAYGQVWKAKNKNTGNLCALKRIYAAFNSVTCAQKVYRQVKYLRLLEHPNIIRLIQVRSSVNQQDIYLQFEYMEGDLALALKNNLLQNIHKHYIFYQIANALSYLHGAELLHRDIKPSNVLINESSQAKLCDFGFIRSVKRQQGKSSVLTQNVSAIWYRAPQLMLGYKGYGKAVDVWSLGCIFAEMFTGRPLFKGNSTIQQLRLIFQAIGKQAKEEIAYLESKQYWDIIDQINVNKEGALRQMLKGVQPQVIQLLEMMLRIDPCKRITAQQLVIHPIFNRFKGKIQIKKPQKINIPYQNVKLAPAEYKRLIFKDLYQKNSEEKDKFKQLFQQESHQNKSDDIPNELKNISPKKLWGSLKSAQNFNFIKKNQNQRSRTPQRLYKFFRSPSFLKKIKKNKSPDESQLIQTAQRLYKKKNIQNAQKIDINSMQKKQGFRPARIQLPSKFPVGTASSTNLNKMINQNDVQETISSSAILPISSKTLQVTTFDRQNINQTCKKGDRVKFYFQSPQLRSKMTLKSVSPQKAQTELKTIKKGQRPFNIFMSKRLKHKHSFSPQKRAFLFKSI